jgi:hypothetical protein
MTKTPLYKSSKTTSQHQTPAATCLPQLMDLPRKSVHEEKSYE